MLAAMLQTRMSGSGVDFVGLTDQGHCSFIQRGRLQTGMERTLPCFFARHWRLALAVANYGIAYVYGNGPYGTIEVGTINFLLALLFIKISRSLFDKFFAEFTAVYFLYSAFYLAIIYFSGFHDLKHGGNFFIKNGSITAYGFAYTLSMTAFCAAAATFLSRLGERDKGRI